MAKSALSRRTLILRGTAVLLAAVAFVVIAARTGKWLTVQRVASRVRTSDDATAGRLVRELAAFGETAYPALLAAANSNRSSVALAARAEVDRLVDHWQQQAFLHPATFSLQRNALPLAHAIERQLPNATVSGRNWARGVLAALVELAQQQDLEQRVALVRICDRALSSLPADEPPLAFEPDVEYRLTLPAPNSSPLPENAFVSEPRTFELTLPPREPGSEAAKAAVASDQKQQPDRETIVLEAIPLETKAEDDDSLEQWNQQWAVDRLRKGLRSQVPAHSASTQRQRAEDDGTNRVSGSATDQLFAQLATGDETSQRTAAKELEKLGYGLVTHRDARMAVSASMADRLALVDLSLTSSRLEPGAWLWRLAHDPAAEVRAAAIASIATTSDRQLIAETLDLALRDTDPRVAHQAELLKKHLR